MNVCLFLEMDTAKNVGNEDGDEDDDELMYQLSMAKSPIQHQYDHILVGKYGYYWKILQNWLIWRDIPDWTSTGKLWQYHNISKILDPMVSINF